MITNLDYKRINELLLTTSLRGKLNDLEKKLHGSTIITSEKTPPDLVTMNSEVTVHDITVNEVYDLRLVYQLSPLYRNQASILAPLGSTLLGMKLNEVKSYKTRDSNTREIQILKILFQPEANGRFDL